MREVRVRVKVHGPPAAKFPHSTKCVTYILCPSQVLPVNQSPRPIPACTLQKCHDTVISEQRHFQQDGRGMCSWPHPFLHLYPGPL